MTSRSPFRQLWTLDPAVDYLNHGFAGAVTVAVQAAQSELRARLERQPMQFFVRDLGDLLDAARARLAGFVGADPADLVAVANATTGVSTVLRSIAPRLAPGDELLTTNHVYGSCRNALEVVAAAHRLVVVTVEVPFPGTTAETVRERVAAGVTPRTRLALLDHVTSPTGLVFPIAELVGDLAARGVDTLVDGAHGPGMVPLDLGALGAAGAAYYTGNAHKWLCAPKGAAFLWVRRDRQDAIRPLVVSHGHDRRRPGRSAFQDAFDIQATDDPTAFLVLPAALDQLGALLPGGWPALMARNRALALFAQARLAAAVGVPPPVPPEMIGSLATLPLADGGPGDPHAPDPLAVSLLTDHHIEVPVLPWPPPARGPDGTAPRWRRVVRVAAQVYNDEAQFVRLAAILADPVATVALRHVDASGR